MPQDAQATSPVIVDRFNDEAESGGDRIDVFAHDVLHYRSFTAVVESTIRWSASRNPRLFKSTYSINIRISLSLRRALRSIDNMLTVKSGPNGVYEMKEK